MACLYYCKNLQKVVPCTIVPDKIKSYSLYTKEYLTCVTYDEISLINYGLSMNQILKYCSDYINIHDLYPCETQEEKEYFNNHVGTSKTVYPEKELIRYEKLFNYISDLQEISYDTLYFLCSLFVTDLQFKYLTSDERVFMKSLSDSQFSTIPDTIYVSSCIRMLLNLFNKYNGSFLDDDYRFDNYNNIKEHESIFPIMLNAYNIKYNMNLIKLNGLI